MMSLRARFFLVSVASVSVALLLALWFLVELFSDSYGRRIDAELTSHVNTLAGVLRFAPDGALMAPESPADNRFRQPYSGLYWQIDDPARKAVLRSPSLFDFALPLPDDAHAAGSIHRYRLPGPDGKDVIVQERAVIAAAPGGTRTIRVTVAIDAAVLDEARSTFARETLPYIAGLALFLVLMSIVQLRLGLAPLAKVAADVDAVTRRTAERLPGPYPAEFTGLTGQVNRLLEAQASAMEKARRRASDLAHGLKTPLTVLANDALTLREKGEAEIADELDSLARSMLAHVDHELTRSRIAHSAELRSADAEPAAIARDIVRTLKRTEHGETLEWTVTVPAGLMLPVDPHDLRELLGNLLENAAKWAVKRISITWSAGSLVIEDDGPGVAPDRLGELTDRGVRLDHRKPGSGLGLAIVKEIVAVYGLALTIENRSPHGLRVTVGFPAHADDTQ
jgi:signal transduction histidine kinase